MLIETHEIIEQLKDYIQEKGGNNSHWFVGTCQEAHGIAFDALKMSSQFWIYFETESSQIAGEVVKYFVNTIGVNRHTVITDPNENGSIVYLYKKAAYPAY